MLLTFCVASFPALPTVQFLITCSMQKWRGKAWSILSCAYVLHFEPGPVHFLLTNVQNSSAWDKASKKRQAHSFSQGPSPPLYLGRHDVIHVIKWTRLSPLVFTYCKQANLGRWEGLGTRLILHVDKLLLLHVHVALCIS